MKSHPREKAYLKKIASGELPTHYHKPRNSEMEEDHERPLVKTIHVADYKTKKYWKSMSSLKPLCKMIKTNHAKKR